MKCFHTVQLLSTFFSSLFIQNVYFFKMADVFLFFLFFFFLFHYTIQSFVQIVTSLMFFQSYFFETKSYHFVFCFLKFFLISENTCKFSIAAANMRSALYENSNRSVKWCDKSYKMAHITNTLTQEQTSNAYFFTHTFRSF